MSDFPLLPPSEKKPQYVRQMFAQIADRYDLLNRLISLGQDDLWRRATLRRLGLRAGDRFLDLGGGTGALTREALRMAPGILPVTSDLTFEMLAVGKAQLAGLPIRWLTADALQLPFPDDTFDALASGFLLRNVADLDAALREQYRVLKPGGRWAALDTSRPPKNLLTPLMRLHLRVVIPWLGKAVARNAHAYRYLQASTEHFLAPPEMVARLEAAGFREVGYQRLMFGAVAVYWGQKPAR